MMHCTTLEHTCEWKDAPESLGYECIHCGKLQSHRQRRRNSPDTITIPNSASIKLHSFDTNTKNNIPCEDIGWDVVRDTFIPEMWAKEAVNLLEDTLIVGGLTKPKPSRPLTKGERREAERRKVKEKREREREETRKRKLARKLIRHGKVKEGSTTAYKFVKTIFWATLASGAGSLFWKYIEGVIG